MPSRANAVVTISYALPEVTLQQFTPAVEQSVVDAVTATLPTTSNVNVYLTNIRAGSVSFDTVVQFLDGNTNVAQALADSVAASASSTPSSASTSTGYTLPAIQLPATLGTVTVTAVPVVLASPNPNAASPPPPPTAVAPALTPAIAPAPSQNATSVFGNSFGQIFVGAARPQQGSTGIVQQSARNFFGGLRLSRSRVGATGETYQAAPGTPHNV
ncbi:hypothetical protein WJX84_001957 [Apatococcus fuscideae]|uniref:Uncharacterized protein n=1 Tax=Apatococcus fuscideae TaxID=2026836 RepID=A0AAW1T671_9CHLO